MCRQKEEAGIVSFSLSSQTDLIWLLTVWAVWRVEIWNVCSVCQLENFWGDVSFFGRDRQCWMTLGRQMSGLTLPVTWGKLQKLLEFLPESWWAACWSVVLIFHWDDQYQGDWLWPPKTLGWWREERCKVEMWLVFLPSGAAFLVWKWSLVLRNLACKMRNRLYEKLCITFLFLSSRDNLEWLARATNWAKFTATASLGVIHKVTCSLPSVQYKCLTYEHLKHWNRDSEKCLHSSLPSLLQGTAVTKLVSLH